jgi:hypothetical protein
MKRFFAVALILGAITPFALVGCAEKSEVKSTDTVTTPGGTTTTESSTEIKKTGDNPPPATGEVPK